MFVFLKHAFSSGVLDMKRPTRTEERRVIKRSHSVSLARLWWFAASVSRDKENEQPQFTVVHKLHGRAPLLCVVISADAFNLEYESERPGSDSIFSVALGNDVTGMKKTKQRWNDCQVLCVSPQSTLPRVILRNANRPVYPHHTPLPLLPIKRTDKPTDTCGVVFPSLILTDYLWCPDPLSPSNLSLVISHLESLRDVELQSLPFLSW